MQKNKIIKLLLLVLCIVLLPACGIRETQKVEPVFTEVEKPAEKQDMPSFQSNNSKIEEKKEPDKIINIKAIGDIMLGRGVAYHTKGDYTLPFKETAEFLKSADITFSNVEFVLSERGQKLEGKINLRGEPKSVEGLKFAGIDIVSIANNHMMDYNELGLLDTMETLSRNNIKYAGAGKNLMDARTPAIIEVKGVKVGFLAYSDFAHYGFWDSPKKNRMRFFEAKDDVSGVAPLKHQDDKNGNAVKYEIDPIVEDIQKLKEQVDLVAVSFHWGVENSHNVPSLQRELAHSIIDAGADMILGHHPHVLQGIEIYKGKPVIYSMGNFIFDQNEKANNESMMVDMDFTNGKLSRLEMLPLQIIAKKQTVFAKDEDAARIMGYVKKLSQQQMDTNAVEKENKLIFDIH
ncbi:CapA family protein [Petroclostridium sp. X23]|jgi:poly-gamma-glutamate synthesis protein (capsule biosynthesis protein)|uniref:CapA family protein n=1 Tax=Petroclostridium sp. X23 TaxID=3045146 RepID=UPI0024ADF1A0|nr:CapA family protein [Petroclostridium sp. X23]WHH56886.1 CapA family protein [Petroclostridium sp. X23]